MIGKIKPTVAIRTELRLIFSESEPVDIQDFCYRSDKKLKIPRININCGTSRAEVENNFVPTNN